MPGGAGPGDAARRHVAWQLREQARACKAMGSPLYGLLLAGAAGDVEAGGPCWQVLSGEVRPGRGHAVALRFAAAVHRLVLTGRAPALAEHYPTAGGTPGGESAWPAFRAAVAEHAGEVARLTALPCQTNEVGRAAGLCGAFLEVAAVTGLPLRLLEIGASAGLNLRWDRFRYGGGGASWGPAGSPVDLTGLWDVPPPRTGVAVDVAERRGCDLDPVDPRTPEGRLALRCPVWPDQPRRLARLDGAIALARDVPAEVDAAAAEDWLARALASPVPGVATVVYHSVVLEYLPEAARAAVRATVEDAGRRARPRAPLAWLRLEPVSALREHGVSLTTWPGGRDRLLARCGAHGTGVVWLD